MELIHTGLFYAMGASLLAGYLYLFMHAGYFNQCLLLYTVSRDGCTSVWSKYFQLHLCL